MTQLAMPDNVCEGNLKHYYVDPNPIDGSTYTWRIDGINQDGTDSEIDIVWNTAGTYLLEVQELSVDGCLGPVRSGQIFVNSSPVAIATSNSPVCEGSSINLYADFVQDATYQWTSSTDFSSIDQNPVIPFASNSDEGTYYLVVSADGCTSIPAMLTLLVIYCDIVDFHIPEGFSPNGDGINDLFVIRGILNFPFNTIVIFNRWGNKVFEASPYQNTWEGHNEFGLRVGGDELPIGTYFYVLDLGDNSDIFKGTIYLNR
jgi:gliding motility-associated-like protein